MARKKQLREL